MNERGHRPWLRFRLATLVVMTLVASGLLAVNLLWPVREPYYFGWVEWGVYTYYGWPLRCYSTQQITMGDYGQPHPDAWSLPLLAADVAIGLGISSAAGICFEWVMRRREKRKKSNR